jgi:hypothetical protein
MTKSLDEVKRVFICLLQQLELFYKPFLPKGPLDLREDLIRISQDIFFKQENDYIY